MFGCSFLWISGLTCPSSPSPPLRPSSIFPSSSPAFPVSPVSPLSLLCLSSAFPSPFLSFLRLPRSFLSAFPLPAFPLPFLGLSFVFPSFLLRLSFVYLSGKRGVVVEPSATEAAYLTRSQRCNQPPVVFGKAAVMVTHSTSLHFFSESTLPHTPTKIRQKRKNLSRILISCQFERPTLSQFDVRPI